MNPKNVDIDELKKELQEKLEKLQETIDRIASNNDYIAKFQLARMSDELSDLIRIDN